MSYDLNVLGPLDEERAAALLKAAGAEGDGDGDELLLEADGVAASFLIRGGEVGIGVATLTHDEAAARDGFRLVLEIVLALSDELGARVYDPQAGRELGVDDAEEAISAFG